MSNDSLEKFDDLVSRHLDGNLSLDEGQHLNNLLSQDPEKAKEFARAAVMHQQLRSVLKYSRTMDANTSQSNSSTIISGWSWFTGGAVTASIIGFIAVLMYYKPQAQQVINNSTNQSKASLVQVGSNTVRLPLPNIGYANIEASSDFEMITPMLARLTKGRINISVTEAGGADFVLETPHGNIKNLEVKCDLNVDSDLDSGLLVRQGSANLEILHPENNDKWTFVKHVVQGEGITFRKSGEINRVMSVVKASPTTYLTPDEILNDPNLIIRGVSDNLKTASTTKFYEVIPGGLKEDVARCVDRSESEWNGIGKEGLPRYLIGADYVKNFGDDVAQSNLEIHVTIGKPAKLYVFYDERLPPPNWLKKDFRNTGDRIGSDAGHYRYTHGNIRNAQLGVGPGISIDDTYLVWEKVVEEPGTVTLGAVEAIKHDKRIVRSIYGIAAVALERQLKDLKK
jgi:hypothetical protein